MAHQERKKLGRNERRELDIEIGFLEGLVRRDPNYVEALQLLGDDYTRRGKFAAGLKVDEQLAQLRPSDPVVLYNLACSYALTDRFQETFDILARALDSGYTDFHWLGRDPDLAGFREHPLYGKLRALIRARQIKVR